MWLVSDECTWVGWKTKRLWNSCQVRAAQNGLLTAFYISLHHSSWMLPLISSPALTWEFNFFSCWFGFYFSPSSPHLPPCLSPPPWPPSLPCPWPWWRWRGRWPVHPSCRGDGAELCWQSGGASPAWPLQPGWAGEDPGSLSGERSENISCAGRWLQGSRKDHSDLDWKANDG